MEEKVNGCENGWPEGRGRGLTSDCDPAVRGAPWATGHPLCLGGLDADARLAHRTAQCEQLRHDLGVLQRLHELIPGAMAKQSRRAAKGQN